MKTINNILLLATLTIVSTLSFVSCEDDKGDTTPPVIRLLSPAEGERLEIGEAIHFEMEVSDNEALGSYKIDIHNNFNGHEHSHTYSSSDDDISVTETISFAFQQSWNDISGKRNALVHHHNITIPTNATPGNYHFMVYCTDAAGNESYVACSVILTFF